MNRRVVGGAAVLVVAAGAGAFALTRDDGRRSPTAVDETTTTTVADTTTTTATTTAPTSSTATTATTGTSAVSNPGEPRPASVPALRGPPDQTSRPSAQRMARVGGLLNEFWTLQFRNGLYKDAPAFRMVRSLRIAEHPLTCGSQTYQMSPGHVFCGPDYFVGLSVQDYDEYRGEGDDTPEPRPHTPELSMWIAHEWGHAVQWSGGTMQRPTRPKELEADCFAGAFLAHARRTRMLPPEELDLKIIEPELRAAGDDFAPAQPGDEHGTGEQRWAAFQRGWNGKVADCLKPFP